jgi:hypothetical protein
VSFRTGSRLVFSIQSFNLSSSCSVVCLGIYGCCLGRDITLSFEVRNFNSNSVGNEQEDSVIEKLMRLYPIQNGIAAL